MSTPLSEPAPSIRAPRLQLTTAGQASPPELGERVAELMQAFLGRTFVGPVTIVDVGCGLGHQMALIKQRCPGAFRHVTGIDWSPATVLKHQTAQEPVYDDIALCSSDRLPFDSQAFDVALSMENLEHLYEQDAVRAISEMMRVAKYLVISTPAPSECINFRWLYPEMVQAVLDDVPLSEHDFICMESAVHKSTVFPASMRDAGFTCFSDRFACYYIGESARINLAKVECVGMPRPDVPPMTSLNGAQDFKWRYVRVLADSANLQEAISAHPQYALDIEPPAMTEVPSEPGLQVLPAETRPRGVLGKVRAKLRW
jgi:ubiquinone/menaquinone biosynthesis C-methylase UbiE